MFSDEACLSTLTFGEKKTNEKKAVIQTLTLTEDSNKAKTSIRMVIL